MTDKPTQLTVEQSRVVIDTFKVITKKRWQLEINDTIQKETDGFERGFERGYRAGIEECAAWAASALDYLERVTDSAKIAHTAAISKTETVATTKD